MTARTSGTEDNARSDRVAMRPLAYPDVARVVGWLRDTEAMREVLPLHVTPQEIDVIRMIEHADPVYEWMTWAFDLADGTPIGFGSWREDLPWTGVYHVEVIVSSLVSRRVDLAADAYRLLVDQVFGTLPARKVTAKAAAGGAVGSECLRRAGLTSEGVLRGHAMLDGTEHDLHLFGMRRGEWSGNGPA